MSTAIDIRTVYPSWRHMMSEEAAKEAKAFFDFIDHFPMSTYDFKRQSDYAELIIKRMPENWPHIARADQKLDSIVTAAIRHLAATHGDQRQRGYRYLLGYCFRDFQKTGNHESIRRACESFIAYRPETH